MYAAPSPCFSEASSSADSFSTAGTTSSISTATSSSSSGQCYFNKALCNFDLIYQQAYKLSGVRCPEEFEVLHPTLRQSYLRTILAQLSVCEQELAARINTNNGNNMSRLRTAIPERQSQDFHYHGLPYLPLPSSTSSNGAQDSTSAFGPQHGPPLQHPHGHHGRNLAATPPMPLPMVDPPSFPTAPPPTPTNGGVLPIYHPHNGGFNENINFQQQTGLGAAGGAEYTWGSSTLSGDGGGSYNAMLQPSDESIGFKADPSSPFRFEQHHMMDIGTVSPHDLHPLELEYHTHFPSSMGLHPLGMDDHLGDMFALSDADISPLHMPTPIPAAVPAYATAPSRRPLPSSAPVSAAAAACRESSNNSSIVPKSSASASTAASGGGHNTSSSTTTASSHSRRRNPASSSSRGSGSGQAPSLMGCSSSSRTQGARGTQVSGHLQAPASNIPRLPMSAQTQGQASGFAPAPLAKVVPSNTTVVDRSMARHTARGDTAEPSRAAQREVSSRSSGTKKSPRSHRKKSQPKKHQNHEHKSSPSSKSTSSPPLRKKKDSSSSTSTNSTSIATESQRNNSSSSSFPPGQNIPGFVPIGRLGVASEGQGNTAKLDGLTKKRIIVAERDAGLTYKAIKNKYTQWREAESTYRGLDRAARLPVEHRERVASWSEQHIQSLRTGMAILRDPMRPNLKGFPWKQLADYIKTETGKPFGATTVKKKWFDIAAEGGHHEIDDEESSDDDEDSHGEDDDDVEMED